MFSRRFTCLLFMGLAGITACAGRSDSDRKDAGAVTLEQVSAVMDRHTSDLMAIPGVVGVSVGALPDSTLTIQVLVRERTESVEAAIPKAIEGVPVVVIETGEIRPLGGAK